MQLFLTLKSMPELRQRSWKERRQVAWQMGLKPYRRLRVWAALVFTSFVVLWGLDTFVGNMFLYPELSGTNKGFASMLTVLLVFVIPATFVFQHAYLKALRPYIRHVKFNPEVSWWGAAFKGLLPDVVFIGLFLACVLGLDWAVNSYDEAPDRRIAAIQSWPDAIPDANNGFIAAVGLQAPAGTAPFDAGTRWLNAIDEAAAKHATDYPKAPEGLKYAGFVAKPKAAAPNARPVKPSPTALFCDIGAESCWKIMQEQRGEVTAWLAANQELLTRYQALQKYLQWQYTIPTGGSNTPFPSYQGMMRGQSLFLASAMAAMDKGQVGKGLDMIGDDMRFVRNMLGSKDMLIGKMIAIAMLSRDLALLAQTIEQRPKELKPYRTQIENMVEPLTVAQVSVDPAFRFEEKWLIGALSQDLLAQFQGDSEAPQWLKAWATHHFKKDATVNLIVRYWDHVISQTEVRDASYSPPIADANIQVMLGISPVTGFLHNLGGKVAIILPSPNYSVYPNKMYDLNTLNNLVRLQVALAQGNVSARDVPAFLAASNKTLRNPETGKPFEWDADLKQIYFIPATDSFKQHYSLGSGVEGRTGLNVAEVAAAAPEPAAKVQVTTKNKKGQGVPPP